MVWYAIMALTSAVIVRFLLRRFGPKQITAHAALSKNADGELKPISGPMFFGDKSGRRIPMAGRVVVNVDGPSCQKFGLQNGSRAIAEVLDKAKRSTLSVGDLVVINSTKDDGKKPYRFRMIETVDGDMLHFRATDGQEWKPKPRADVFARVIYK